MAFHSDNPRVAAPAVSADSWSIAGTILLLLFVGLFVFLISIGHRPSHPIATHTSTPHQSALVATPLPSGSTPAPAVSPAPSVAPSDVAQLPATGPLVASSAAPSTRATAHPAPTAHPTSTAKPAAVDHPPTAILNITPSGGPHPLPVTASGTSSWDGDATGIATYEFFWGDGLESGAQTNPIASHLYDQAGDYTITLIVTDSAGHASTSSQTVTVT